MPMFTPKEHQLRSKRDVLAAFASGQRRVLLYSPTGTGKTFTSATVIQDFLDREKRVIFYTNRRALLDQSKGNFEKYGITSIGVRAAGWPSEPWISFQVSSLQTEVRRLAEPFKYQNWTIFEADLVVIDEAHLNGGPTVQDLVAQHMKMGAYLLGITATPIDLGHLYDHMIVGCTMKEGRDSGLLVKAVMFGPDEPDLKAIGKVKPGEDVSEARQRKAIMTPTIFGRVFDWWRKLNPHAKPTLGFAPGVDESIGFVEDWRRRGVRAAHIDGDDIWIDGELIKSDTDSRRQIFEDYEAGRIVCIWNRFVLREGIDLPIVEHLILACIFGSLQTNIQSIGRGLRACEGKTRCVIQDHGGNYWRHGSPNADREWRLEYTSAMIEQLWNDRHKHSKLKEGYRCPNCAMILAIAICPNCGHEVEEKKRPRMVIQIDGSPKFLSDSPVYKPPRVYNRPDGPAIWKRMILYRFPKTDMTFKQAEGCFAHENYYAFPDRRWPYMPIHEADFYRRVRDVRFEDLKSE